MCDVDIARGDSEGCFAPKHRHAVLECHQDHILAILDEIRSIVSEGAHVSHAVAVNSE